MPMRRFDVEFTKDGEVFRPEQADALVAGLGSVTDLIVACHGWNNDMADARRLYNELLGHVDALLDRAGTLSAFGPLAGRTFAVCQVYWPSKRFADEDLIPGGGAAIAGPANNRALIRVLESLARDPVRLGGKEAPAARRKAIESAIKAVPKLESSALARKRFVDALRKVLPASTRRETDDGSAAFFKATPDRLFEAFAAPVQLGATAGAGLDDLFEGPAAAARRLANFVTYYEMKERAGQIGSKGLGPLLKRCRKAFPTLRLHLVGHSFGARLVAAAAAALPKQSAGVTMSLLQAAFSHNAFSEDFGRGKPGFFRTVVGDQRVTGPIVVTHTKNDRAVGIAYPLASRLANQVAAALGDEQDPYGGLGRNGAQHTAEAAGHAAALGPAGTIYGFAPGAVYNLRADTLIADHGDVKGEAVAYTILCCTAAV